ncbi:MAG: hypothetical protein RIR26_1949 [Pseudomonadota bacterium]
MIPQRAIPSPVPLCRPDSDASNLPDGLLDHFLLQFQSPHTRRSYKIDIISFFDFWRDRGSPLAQQLCAVTEKHLLLWLESQTKSATRARKLASLSSFFEFCIRHKHIENNPCALLRRPKVTHRKTAQALSEEEVQKLLSHLHDEAFEPQFEGPHAERQKRSALLNLTVLFTLFSVGMRVDELCELRICDLTFEPEACRMRFVSKGGEEHSTLVAEGCAAILRHYLQTLRKGSGPSETVFVRVQTSKNAVKLSQTAIFKMIQTAARSAGIEKTLSPHSARATVATVLHRNGTPLGFIQMLLNHKQITTTARYVKKANERSESAALKAPVQDWLNLKTIAKKT